MRELIMARARHLPARIIMPARACLFRVIVYNSLSLSVRGEKFPSSPCRRKIYRDISRMYICVMALYSVYMYIVSLESYKRAKESRDQTSLINAGCARVRWGKIPCN